MKKYLIIKPFSLLEKSLLLQDDIVYAEEVRTMTHVYLPRTRKLLGKIATIVFTELVMEIPS
tara:strand:+ start:30939 stop:31124 length:186 start_codon:yes stop_codon:yes gene_type:complete